MNSQQKQISILAIGLFIFGWISVNIYLPALPFLSHDLHTQIENLKLSITLFLLGFAVSQLIWGPISEKYGRKKPIIVGLILTNLGILLAMFAVNIWMFNSARFVEAFGLGVAPVLGRAMLIDVLDTAAFAAVMAYGTISANMMPAIAPIIGGHVLVWFGWRYIFLVLLIYGLFMLYQVSTAMQETHRNKQHHLRILQAFKYYLETLRNKRFIAYLIPYTLVTGAMVGYYTLTPFLFITRLHISANQYGFLSLITVASYILGAVTSRLYSKRVGIKRMVFLGLGLLILAICAMMFTQIALGLTVTSVLIPMSIYTYAAGIICPNSNAGAMAAMRHKAGASAAVIGFSLYCMSAILSTIITNLPLPSLWPLTIYISIVTITALIVFYRFTGR